MKKIRLKTLGAFCLVLALAILDGCEAHAQDTNTVQSIAAGAKGATNIVAIPFVKYDLTTKNFGYGVAALYRVTDNFWTGLRVDRIDGLQTTAGVQAQLKTTLEFEGIKIHPFVETSVGIGQDALYGSAGSGAFLNLISHDWQRSGRPPVTLNVGLIADYEHVVQSGTVQNNSNQINGGPMINLSF